MKKWRLIIDPSSQTGARNMAIDEFLFNSLKDKGETVLRFYTWIRPTVSLGWRQKAEKVVDLQACRRLGVDIVRRPTGGKLVLHHLEVTYSVCSSDIEIFPPSVEGSYRLISQALITGLKLMGLKAELAEVTEKGYARSLLPCFVHAARHEIIINGRKVIGSAQRRVGERFLQHGSIPLSPHDNLLRQITPLHDLNFSSRMISLEEALGRKVESKEVIPFFIEGFKQFFGVAFEEKPLSSAELEKVKLIEDSRYSQPLGFLEKGRINLS